jgi:hypothetical protein
MLASSRSEVSPGNNGVRDIPPSVMEPSQYNSHKFETSIMLTHNRRDSWITKILELPLYLQVYQKWQGAE